MDYQQLLRIYLNDHLTAANAEVSLFRRVSRAHWRSEYAGEIAALSREVESDRQALTALFQEGRPGLWEHIEETVFRSAYAYCEGNQVQTSKLLDLSRNIVRARTAQFGIHQAIQRTTDTGA